MIQPLPISSISSCISLPSLIQFLVYGFPVYYSNISQYLFYIRAGVIFLTFLACSLPSRSQLLRHISKNNNNTHKKTNKNQNPKKPLSTLLNTSYLYILSLLLTGHCLSHYSINFLNSNDHYLNLFY